MIVSGEIRDKMVIWSIKEKVLYCCSMSIFMILLKESVSIFIDDKQSFAMTSSLLL